MTTRRPGPSPPEPTFRPHTQRPRLITLLLATLALALLAACATPSSGARASPRDKGPRVGVNYHAIASDYVRDSFVSRYQEPDVRQTVKRQLHDMAAMGAQVVKTTLWVVANPAPDPLPREWSWVIHFPPTPQEIANITAYVQDVAETPLRLEIAFTWLGCADYVNVPYLTGAADELVPNGCAVRRTWAEFELTVQMTYDAVLSAIAPVTRADGTKVVSMVHGEIEVELQTKPNSHLFLQRLWPYFRTAARAAGLVPSFYFIVDANETNPNAQLLLDTIRFMLENGISDLPARLDFSFYPMKAWKRPWTGEWIPTTAYDRIVRAVIDDIQRRVLPLTGPRGLGIAETPYPVRAWERIALGQALARAAEHGRVIEQVLFWPHAVSTWYRAAPPFDFGSYAPDTRATRTFRPR